MKTPLRVMHRTDKKTLGNVYKSRGLICEPPQPKLYQIDT